MPRAEAPEPLRLVESFVNTIELGGADQFDRTAGLAAWLSGEGLLPESSDVSEKDRRQAVRMRAGLRALLEANDGGDPDPGQVEDLNRLAAALPLAVRFEHGGSARLEPRAAGAAAALSRILAAATTARAEGTWSRLKLCRAHTCRWAFYDRSKNRSSAWCSMAVCGNRTKARAYRQRHS